MAKETQRVKEMIEGFMNFHREGLGIAEIAEIFHVSPSVIYKKYLSQIAEANGLERKDLLERIHPPHGPSKKETCRQACTDFESIQNIASELNEKISELIFKINNL